MSPRLLYRVTMEDGSRLTVLAANGVEAAAVAIGQYFAATGIKVCVEDYELAEGYDIA